MSHIDSDAITVIIPTYRRPELLRRAVASAQRQTHANLRICVYDNASGDSTEQVVRTLAEQDPRVLYHCHAENIGPLRNFQFGLENVRTQYFAFLSDDDALAPGCYEAGLRGLEAHPRAMFAAARVINKDEAGRLTDPVPRWQAGFHEPPEGLLSMLRNGLPIWIGIVFRREVVDRIGLLDLGIPGSLDAEFELRAAARCPYVLVPELGAVFSSRSANVEAGVRPFEFAWSAALGLVDKLRREPLPAQAREEAVRLLEGIFAQGLLEVSVAYASQRRYREARSAAALLRSRFPSHRGARALPLLVAAWERVPGANVALRAALRLRRFLRSRGRYSRDLEAWFSEVDVSSAFREAGGG